MNPSRVMDRKNLVLTDHEECDCNVISARSPQGPQQSASTRADEARHADAQYGPTNRWRTEAAALLRHCVPGANETTVGR